MGKLHELIAVEPDLKTEATRLAGEITNLFANGQVKLKGLTRTYRPLEETGDKFPDEVANVATTVKFELAKLAATFGRWMDAAIQKELTNSTTKASVMVGSKVVLADLNAPALLNMEGKLVALRGVYEAIPTNDLTERWAWNDASGMYLTPEEQNYRTKKVVKPLVLYPATPEHPAQTDKITEDIREGVWTITKSSGMLSPVQKSKFLANLDELLRAVKAARQRANEAEVVNYNLAKVVFEFIHKE